ncbi:MAG: alpha/beta hydrolase [Actinocrinis sp.]
MTTTVTVSSAEKSTIVRTIPTRQQRLVRATFRLLERRAPRVGAVWAERLWCKVPKVEARPSVAAAGTVATLPLGEEDGAPRFVAESWGDGDAAPVVYLLHGWGGYRGQLGAFVAPLVDAGYRVVALDAPSHGESGPGRFGAGRGLLPEFIAALTAAVRVYGPAYGVVAHSLGGGAVALSVLDGMPASRLVLIAPLPDAIAYTRVFAEVFGFGERVRTGLLDRLERRVGRPMTDFNAVERAGDAAAARVDAAHDGGAVPLLVVHDRDDKVIPYGQGRAIAKAWQGAELLTTRGLGHRGVLRDTEVIRSAVDFLGVER